MKNTEVKTNAKSTVQEAKVKVIAYRRARVTAEGRTGLSHYIFVEKEQR